MELYALFHKASTLAFRALRRRVRGLSITDASILLYLEHQTTHDFSVTELARAIHLSIGWVSRVVDVLVKRGLIESVRDGHDRRSVHLKLTDKGTKIARLPGATLQKSLEASFSEISAEQRSVIAQFLRTFAGKLRDYPRQ